MTPAASERVDFLLSKGTAEDVLRYAAELRSAGDPRGELIPIQLALESAQGSEVRPLLLAEERVLREHAATLLPWENRERSLSGLRWRRGFIEDAALADYGNIVEDIAPLTRAMRHPSMQRARTVSTRRWCKYAPRSIESLWLTQAVVTRGMCALPRLRSLHIENLVAGSAVICEGLERLTVGSFGATAMLDHGELPSLKRLGIVKHGTADCQPSLFAALAQHNAPLVLRHSSRWGWWTDADLRRLSDTSCEIVELSWRLGPGQPMPAGFPSLRRLVVTAPDVPDTELMNVPMLPNIESVEELALQTSPRAGLEALLRCLGDNPMVNGLRRLTICTSSPVTAAFAKRTFRKLEELRFSFRSGAAAVKAILEAGAFPALRRVETGPNGLRPLAASPYARQVEWLGLSMLDERTAQSWLATTRPAFPRLKVLAITDALELSAETRALMEEQGLRLVWRQRVGLGLPSVLAEDDMPAAET